MSEVVGFSSIYFGGMQVFTDNHIGWEWIQTRYPASRCKRIRRKFRRLYQQRIQRPLAYQAPGLGIVANSPYIELMKKVGLQ
jgi:hypothetical protein